MEDNSLESLPSPSATSTTPTTTTATTTISTNTTRASIAELAATTGSATIGCIPERQQQLDQLAAAPANKCHHDLPYDWQLLSQEELDRIAYNSRRQTKARQRANPPKCAYCPEARFNSMIMLSTHYLSRRHLARARKQEQTHGQGQDQAQNADTDEHTTQSGTISSLQGTAISVAASSPSHDVSMEDAVAASESNLATQEHPTRTKKTAIQRKRRQERDRKKARAHCEKQSKRGHSVVSQRAQGQEEMKDDFDAIMSTSNDMLEDKHRNSHKDDEKVSTAPSDSSAQLALRDTSGPLVSGGDIAASIALATPSISNASYLRQQQQPQRQRRYCSICSSSWRQERAWKGHLLSAQHLRHTLATMQQIAPDIQPYGRVDVIASMDPFGWGTGAGVVEEEEESDDEEEGDGNDDASNNVEGKAGDDDGDDMEMSD
ncbi:hypothetical protein BKA57DRAFT_231175 [Linnemannia elongata]|nr:hypothetical protein BKA57DRAFT_231175 [Linnemannia elongata]